MHSDTQTPSRFLAPAVLLALAAGAVVMGIEQVDWLKAFARGWTQADIGEPWRGGFTWPAQSVRGLLWGLLIFWIVSSGGYFLISFRLAMRRAIPSLRERMLLAPLIGAVPFSLLMLANGLVGRIGGNGPGHGVPGWIIILSGFGTGRLIYDLHRRRRMFHRSGDGVAWGIWLMAVPIALIAIPYALSPSVESDELRYHLAAPATWLRDGRIHYLPFQAFSNFPMLAEMLFLPALHYGGAGAAKLLHLAMLPVCVGLVRLTARKWMRLRGVGGGAGARGAARWAGMAFAVLPLVPILAAWAFVDLFVTAYFLAFVYVGLRAIRFPRRGGAFLLGMLIAGGAGTKYTMIPLMGGLTAVWALCLLARGVGWRGALRGFAIAGLVGGTLGGAWLARNYAWTGNPVYPLAWSKFAGGEWSAANEAFYLAKAGEKGYHLAGLPAPLARVAEWAITPWSTYLHLKRFENHYAGPLPFLAALLLAVGGLAGLLRRGGQPKYRAERVWLWSCLLISWIFWFLTYQSTRMLLPTIGLALAGAAMTLRAAWPGLLDAGRMLVRVLAGLAVTVSLIFYFSMMLLAGGGAGKADAVAVGMGFQDPRLYLARRVPYSVAAGELKRAMKSGERALLIGEHRTLYFDVPIVASDWFDTPQPLTLIRATEDNNELFAKLKAEQVRYVLVNYGEMNQYLTQFLQPRMTAEEFARFQALLQDARLKSIYENIKPNSMTDIRVYQIQD